MRLAGRERTAPRRRGAAPPRRTRTSSRRERPAPAAWAARSSRAARRRTPGRGLAAGRDRDLHVVVAGDHGLCRPRRRCGGTANSVPCGPGGYAARSAVGVARASNSAASSGDSAAAPDAARCRAPSAAPGRRRAARAVGRLPGVGAQPGVEQQRGVLLGGASASSPPRSTPASDGPARRRRPARASARATARRSCPAPGTPASRRRQLARPTAAAARGASGTHCSSALLSTTSASAGIVQSSAVPRGTRSRGRPAPRAIISGDESMPVDLGGRPALGQRRGQLARCRSRGPPRGAARPPRPGPPDRRTAGPLVGVAAVLLRVPVHGHLDLLTSRQYILTSRYLRRRFGKRLPRPFPRLRRRAFRSLSG